MIIPAWRAADTIGRALASVLADQVPGVECLVVDDASPDGTADAAVAAAAGDARVRVLRLERNGGVSEARNRGLDEARGSWLTFLDADDRLLPGGLRALADGATEGALAVIGQRISTDGQRTWIPQLYDRPDIRVAGWKSIAANPGLLYYASPHGKLFRRSVVEGLRFEGRVLGDQPWILRALLRSGDRIRVLPNVVYEWGRPHPDRDGPGITASRERSAHLAAEAVAMAGVAFRVVGGEMARTVPAEGRPALEAAYVERLLEADLAAQLAAAIRRRDQALPELLAALEGFIADLPTAVVARSDALRTRIVRPLLARWWWLPRGARPATRNLLRPVLLAARACPSDTPRRSPEQVAISLGARLGWRRGSWLVTGLLATAYAPYGAIAAARLALRRRRRDGPGAAGGPREASA